MLVVLCHPSDVLPEEGERDRWLNFFHPEGRDPGNVIGYLTDVSLGRYDSSTLLVTDWLDIGHNAAEAAAVGGIPPAPASRRLGRTF
ncbi:hypothetical protein [Actinomadura citrea]|uniref:Uncharacterized protein n=1 Tax=Actinomadura citrea TaxID=46158 RepID=A0A7Y9GB05_9ACTN|nr:hypothetical protein [Actinomadura citrea]NYE13214.1 hypothetical protein [Actinomadura citrea]GGU04762.1 hypothetical protein GCM10010177_75090 [Actinomadura citrea]